MHGRGPQPWNGPNKCSGFTVGGLPCSELEIDGLEYCILHVPLDLLPEAEEVTGLLRCHNDGGCPQMAVEGTEDNPRCNSHKGPWNTPKGRSIAAKGIENQVIDRLEEILASDGERLLNPARIEDPFTELLNLAAEMKAFKEILRVYVAQRRIDQMRYTGKTGEQIRAEVVLYERALERLERILTNILKLGIEDRLAGVEERTIELIERALDTSIKAGVKAAAGGSSLIEAQQEARDVLRRELPVLAA